MQTKPIPEDVLRRWLPSDDLEDNAATLRALGFEVEVHDVGEEGDGPLGIYRGARMQGTKRFLTARKIVKSGIAEHVQEGRTLRAVWALNASMSVSIKQDGRRTLSGSFGVEAASTK